MLDGLQCRWVSLSTITDSKEVGHDDAGGRECDLCPHPVGGLRPVQPRAFIYVEGKSKTGNSQIGRVFGKAGCISKW
jgi:hypothetical protein